MNKQRIDKLISNLGKIGLLFRCFIMISFFGIVCLWFAFSLTDITSAFLIWIGGFFTFLSIEEVINLFKKELNNSQQQRRGKNNERI
jgi:hypothetical protein